MLIRPLSNELQEVAKLELNEVPARIEDDINHILAWISQQPHLNARAEPQWILTFLRGCKFSLQRTKEKLEFYYTMRSIAPFYFTNRNPFLPELQQLYKQNVFAPLPRASPTASTTVLIVARNADPEKCFVKECIRAILMLVDARMYEDDALAITGVEVILDGKDASKNYLAQFTPAILKTIVVLIQRPYPIRLKGIHLVNIPPLYQFAINIFSSFLSSEFRNRLHVYSRDNRLNLFDAIPRIIFPEEYGGNAGPLNQLSEEVNCYIESHYEWLQNDSQYGTDESKRTGKPTTYEQYFNVEGSFRQLTID